MHPIRLILEKLLRWLPWFRVIIETRRTQTPVTLSHLLRQRVFGRSRQAYWPVHPTSIINNWRNVYAGIDVSPGYSPGCYIQALNPVYIGDYTQIGPNVGIISANHDLYDSRKHLHNRGVSIGSYCWIGMNAVVLPEVTLGNFSIVGAGAVVTKSFPQGYCVLAGNPARMVRELDRARCLPFKNEFEYNGFIRKEVFDKFRRRSLSL